MRTNALTLVPITILDLPKMTADALKMLKVLFITKESVLAVQEKIWEIQIMLPNWKI